MTVRKFGWRPQLSDQRDKNFFDLPNLILTSQITSIELGSLIDLREKCPAPYDQGELGSCTANAIAFLCEYEWMKQAKPNPFVPSRLFIYYNERFLEGTTSSDAGANIRDGIKSLNKWGFPPEASWPYNITEFADKPPSQAYVQALKEQVKDYGYINQNMINVKTALASLYPVVIGFTVYESFMSDEVAKTGKVPMPGKNESVMGGHAVAIIGYDDDQSCWIVRNSWGSGWGDKGYFYMPYDYFLNPNLAIDLWCVRMVP
jgi:C1A family cysteine protease